MEASGLIQYRFETKLNQKDPVKMIDFYLLKRELNALIKKKKKMSPGKNLIEMNLFQRKALPVTKLHVGLDTCSFEILWPARQMTQEMNGSASGCHPAGSGLTYPHIHLDCYLKVCLRRNIIFQWCYTSAWNKHWGFRVRAEAYWS